MSASSPNVSPLSERRGKQVRTESCELPPLTWTGCENVLLRFSAFSDEDVTLASLYNVEIVARISLLDDDVASLKVALKHTLEDLEFLIALEMPKHEVIRERLLEVSQEFR